MAIKVIPAKPIKPTLAKHRAPGESWKRAMQKMFEQVLGELQEIKKQALAEKQSRSEKIRKATIAGLARAKKRGTKLGRPPGKPKIDARIVWRLRREGLKQGKIAKAIGCSQALVSKLLKKKSKGKK